MTVCETGRENTTYCCNDWTGRRCDCNDGRTPRVTLGLFEAVVTIAPAAAVGEKGKGEGDVDGQDGEGKKRGGGIPWDTVGPVLVAVVGLGIVGMLLYLARIVYVAHRRKDPTRNPSILEHGRRFSEFFWNRSLDEKGRADSKFSVGTLDTDGDGDRDGDDRDMDRKMSTRSVSFSTGGRRGKSEGFQNVVLPESRAETPLPVFREDIFTRKPSGPSSTVASPKSLPRVVGRPSYKRQDTDLGALGDVRRFSVTLAAAEMMKLASVAGSR